jgi:exonuclease SbcC
MIKKLSIKNFQRHKDLELDLSPGVNVIVGKSRRGKSSVVRALRWLVFNRPLGESFRRWGSDTTWVDAHIGDTHLCRKKSDKENCYQLSDGVRDPQYFYSFGQSPPEAIQQLLNLGEMNFSNQHDPLFLLSMSPPEVGRVLNDIAGLDQIDRAFSRIGSMLHKARQLASSTKSDRERLQSELSEYDALDQLDVEVSVLEQLQSEADKALQRGQKLSSIATKLRQEAILLDQYKDLPDLESSVSRISILALEMDAAQRRAQELAGLSQESRRLRSELVTFRNLPRMDAEIHRLDDLGKELGILADRGNDLSKLSKAIRAVSKEHKDQSDTIKATQDEFDRLMPDVCPLCGNMTKGGDSVGKESTDCRRHSRQRRSASM